MLSHRTATMSIPPELWSGKTCQFRPPPFSRAAVYTIGILQDTNSPAGFLLFAVLYFRTRKCYDILNVCFSIVS